MAWTSPRTWVAGEVVTAAELNTHVRDNLISVLPVGSVIDYDGATDPASDTRWLIANGRLLSRTGYADYFALVGTRYSAGDGSTTFGMVNLQDLVTIGASGTHALGSSGGEASHTLSISEMPPHDHALQIDGSNRPGSAVAYGGLAATLDAGGGGAGAPVKITGGGVAHNNMQPYRAMNKLVKVL